MTRLPTLLTGAVGVVVASGAVASAVSPHNGALAYHKPTPSPSLTSRAGAALGASRKAPEPLRGAEAAVAAAETLVAQADAQVQSAATALRKAHRRKHPPAKVSAASDAVHAAEAQRRRAHAVLRQVRFPRSAGGPGAAQFARACRKAGAIDGICRPVPWREDHLVVDSVVISRLVQAKWPRVRKIWGWRQFDAYPDHPAGRAVDIMIPSPPGDDPRAAGGYDTALGNEIARYFQRHAERHGIYYILWRQRMWLAGNRPDAWTHMSDRGSDSANHIDHVHISVRGSHTGRAFESLIKHLAS